MGLTYNAIAGKLNTKLKKDKVKHTAVDFQGKHGPKGRGDGGQKPPYRFGNFATTDPTVVDAAQQAKWLIDTGTNNRDPTTFGKLEELIRGNLSDDGEQIAMKFTIVQGSAKKASAVWVRSTDPEGDPFWDVTLTCRTDPF
jgi:hypothetical protein